MATKAALEPSQLESHITSLMRASFGRLKVNMSYPHAPVFTHIPLQQPYAVLACSPSCSCMAALATSSCLTSQSMSLYPFIHWCEVMAAPYHEKQHTSHHACCLWLSVWVCIPQCGSFFLCAMCPASLQLPAQAHCAHRDCSGNLHTSSVMSVSWAKCLLAPVHNAAPYMILSGKSLLTFKQQAVTVFVAERSVRTCVYDPHQSMCRHMPISTKHHLQSSTCDPLMCTVSIDSTLTVFALLLQKRYLAVGPDAVLTTCKKDTSINRLHPSLPPTPRRKSQGSVGAKSPRRTPATTPRSTLPHVHDASQAIPQKPLGTGSAPSNAAISSQRTEPVPSSDANASPESVLVPPSPQGASGDAAATPRKKRVAIAAESLIGTDSMTLEGGNNDTGSLPAVADAAAGDTPRTPAAGSGKHLW